MTKKNGKCSGCGLPIEPADKVVTDHGLKYHDECAPGRPTCRTCGGSTSECHCPIFDPGEGETKAKNDDRIAELVALVGALSAQVEELKASRAVEPAAEKRSSKKGTPRPHVFYELLGFPTEKFPPQCLRVMKCLAQAAPEGGKMTEVEVHDALMGEKTKIGPWHYRQDPFYIFKYYRAQMIDGDYLRGPFQS